MGQNESINQQISNIRVISFHFVWNFLFWIQISQLVIAHFTVEYLEKHRFKEHGYVEYSIKF